MSPGLSRGIAVGFLAVFGAYRSAVAAQTGPLAAAIVWAWFRIFPVAEWSYYLLAMLMPALALWFAWRLSADYLAIEKRIVGLALLTLVPFFNFHGDTY